MPDETPVSGGPHALLEVVEAQHRGQAVGITSVCSANEFVLQAAVALAQRRGHALLVEATCNQVNQEGGYTGRTPAGFRDHLQGLASQAGLPPDQLILGGDHLGPHVWRARPATEAMARARRLVGDCVRAGYRKIHLDASMHCADDDRARPLPMEVAAARAAQLAQVAEAAAEPGHLPHYVIGTEVPIPGGTLAGEGALQVSSPDSVEAVIAVTRRAFRDLGLAPAWERVVAVVAQPGVEFGDAAVHHYNPEAARPLARLIEGYPAMVYEVHSTDYQRRGALRQLVRDHFAILKVGPALTFAVRRALLALERIEARWGAAGRPTSNLTSELDAAMRANPVHWQGYSDLDPEQAGLAVRDGFSDRTRYYWSVSSVRASVGRLLANLRGRAIPAELLDEFLPELFPGDGSIARDAPALIAAAVERVLDDYEFACGRITSQARGDTGNLPEDGP